jgi:cell division protein FtsB
MNRLTDKQKIEQLNAQLRALTSHLTEGSAAIEKEIDRFEKEHEQLVLKINVLVSDKKGLQSELSKLHDETDVLVAEINSLMATKSLCQSDLFRQKQANVDAIAKGKLCSDEVLTLHAQRKVCEAKLKLNESKSTNSTKSTRSKLPRWSQPLRTRDDLKTTG